MHELEDVLIDLEPVHQKALALAAMGYDAHAIARTIGRTDGATRTMLCRVRAKVRAQVAASAQPIAS
jgi:DNA-directed RNA polymerase specialized sigma24 family protein